VIPRVVESAWVHVMVGGTDTEALGRRIIEVAISQERHELRDPVSGYRAYVPRGSIARGQTIAQSGQGGPAVACVACHGTDLRGVGVIPPLAGRSPTYIVRQLLSFRTGTRSAEAGAPMMPVVALLNVDDMIAAAAYAASLEP
jgi:cytochrome c553